MTRADALEILLGLGLVVAGVAMLSVAAAFITAGAGLIVYAVLPMLRRGA
jgi:hypothetical protein